MYNRIVAFDRFFDERNMRAIEVMHQHSKDDFWCAVLEGHSEEASYQFFTRRELQAFDKEVKP